MMSMKNNEIKYSSRYPNVNLGWGSDFPGGKFKINFKLLFHKFWWRDFKWEIKQAWRRATKGYDKSISWSTDDHLTRVMIRALLELAEHSHGVPNFDGFDQNKYAEMSSEEANKVTEERAKKWQKLLAEIAENLYESLSGEECKESNQYEDEYFNSHKIEFQPCQDHPKYSTMVSVPINGYTEDEVEILRKKHRDRDNEIDKYKKEQFRIGMEKMLKVWDCLWD